MSSNPATLRADTRTVTVLTTVDWIALALIIIGGVNWGLIGAFNVDLVAAIFGPMSTFARIVYVLVGLAALYGIALAVKLSGRKY